MNSWCRLELRINTKIKEVEELGKMVKPIIAFCDKHDVALRATYNTVDECLYARIDVEGLTSRYCRGMAHEVKQMYKNTLKCKIDVLLEAY